jgi:thermostable 8-oxoguanine DNA glycosylase
VIAKSKKEAKQKAKMKLKEYLYMEHVDEIVDVYENIGFRFGLKKKDVLFEDTPFHHQFVKLVK